MDKYSIRREKKIEQTGGRGVYSRMTNFQGETGFDVRGNSSGLGFDTDSSTAFGVQGQGADISKPTQRGFHSQLRSLAPHPHISGASALDFHSCGSNYQMPLKPFIMKTKQPTAMAVMALLCAVVVVASIEPSRADEGPYGSKWLNEFVIRSNEEYEADRRHRQRMKEIEKQTRLLEEIANK